MKFWDDIAKIIDTEIERYKRLQQQRAFDNEELKALDIMTRIAKVIPQERPEDREEVHNSSDEELLNFIYAGNKQ